MRKEKFMLSKDDLRIWIGIGVLAVVGLIALLSLSDLGFLGSVRVIFGSVFVLFLPGFVITYLFFNEEEVDMLEKIALSFALSIAVVPLMTFYTNFLLGIKISALSVAVNVLVIVALAYAIKWQEDFFLKLGRKLGLSGKGHKTKD